MNRRSRSSSLVDRLPPRNQRRALRTAFGTDRRIARLLWLIPFATALAAYGGSSHAAFLFDDVPALGENAALHRGDFLGAAFGRPHSPLSNRPVACLTFAMNLAFGGLTPAGCRAFSLALHLANVVLLAAVLRRTLLAPAIAARFTDRRATIVAVVTASLWGVHPLGSEAVVYLTQRTTLLLTFFFLLMLYGLLRASAVSRPAVWNGLAVAAAWLGMGSKEEFVAAPLLAILFERAFLYPSWSAMRPRVATYAWLASSWLMSAGCVAAGPANSTVGYHTIPQASAWEWLLTEAGVLVHYLRLTVWPFPLRAAYDWPIVRDVSAAVLPGLFIVSLLVVTIGLWFVRPAWGWPGAMFFLLLAPTSSILPIVTELVAERRMYLPMAALLIPAILAVDAGLRRFVSQSIAWRNVLLGLAVATPAGLTAAGIAATRSRAAVYDDEYVFWADVYQKNELTNRSFLSGIILSGFGKVVAERGRPQEANELFRRALECEAPTLDTRVNYAASLVDLGRPAEAEPTYREALQTNPQHVNALGNLAKLLYDIHQSLAQQGLANQADPRLLEAESLIQRAMQIKPGYAGHLNTWGMILYGRGRQAEAEQVFRRSIEVDPTSFHAARNLGVIWIEQGRIAETTALWLPYVERRPTDPIVPASLAAAYRRQADIAAAIRMLHEALRRAPGDADLRAQLAELTGGS